MFYNILYILFVLLFFISYKLYTKILYKSYNISMLKYCVFIFFISYVLYICIHWESFALCAGGVEEPVIRHALDLTYSCIADTYAKYHVGSDVLSISKQLHSLSIYIHCLSYIYDNTADIQIRGELKQCIISALKAMDYLLSIK